MEDFIASIAGFGMEIGVRLFGDSPSQHDGLHECAVAELIVRSSANQAAYIMKSLGLARHVEALEFCKIAGVIGGNTVALLNELTDHDISITESTVPNADAICLSAFNAMRR